MVDLSDYPYISLAHLPTPIQHLPRLSRFLGGPEIFIKRDDCTGLGFGGNKARKLEFLLGDALSQGATTIVTMGTVQSNHLPLTAAAACKIGFKCELILEHRVAIDDIDYLESGNVLVNRLFGANTQLVSGGEDAMSVMTSTAAQVRSRGEKPYVIPRGGSNAVGSLGYVKCASEIVQQSDQAGLSFDSIVHSTASAGTQAGLLVGLRAMQRDTRVIGISANSYEAVQSQKVFALACETAELLGISGIVAREDVLTNSDYIGDGYGKVSDDMQLAVAHVAKLEGILLDPVYSGKCVAGLIDMVRNGFFVDAKNVLLIHTGGGAALFGYKNQLSIV